MKKITLISACLLVFFINQLSASGSRLSRIIARGLHSSAVRARGNEYHDAILSFRKEQERRLEASRVNSLDRARRDKEDILNIFKKNAELMNIEINLLRAQVQRLSGNQQDITHRINIGALDKIDSKK